MNILCTLLMLVSIVLPQSDKYLVLVNKDNPISTEYEHEIRENLEPIYHTRRDGRDTQYMQKDAARALDALLFDADNAGYEITVTSAYRSKNYQKKIYDMRFGYYVSSGKSESEAKELTEKYIAPPGCSEHHTGLAVDMHCLPSAETSFADTEEFSWLCENAAKYGFIIRYPKGKEDITGYGFEPWHFRYVGACASEIANSGLTLEEYVKKLGSGADPS